MIMRNLICTTCGTQNADSEEPGPRQWVMRPDNAIAFWDGDTKPLGNRPTLVRCGGHFKDGTVLHWQGGAGGKRKGHGI